MAELTKLSATELAGRARAGEASATEAVRQYLARVERLNPTLNAVTDLAAEEALAVAARLDEAQAAGRPLGSLHGVPMTIKSSIDVVGRRVECGSRFRQGVVAERDAPLVERLRRAGAVILGTTNTPDMLMAYETDNYLYGRTNNPWGLEYTPGGSSGGEAAAVAGRFAAAGVGSDGGGSIRVPAHFCGIYGLKPTAGLIPRTGHWPACLATGALLGLVGPLARSARDIQALLEATAGPERHDPSSAPVPVERRSRAELSRLRVGVIEEDPYCPVTPETREAVRRAAEALASQGLAVETAAFPENWLAEARRAWWILFGVAGATLTEPLIRGREQDVHPLSRLLFGTGEEVRAMTYPEFLNAWVERDRLRNRLLALMERFDCLICPTASIPAFRHGEREWRIAGKTVRYPKIFTYSQVFNLTGHPVLTAPAGRSAEGLPIGVQLVVRPFEDSVAVGLGELLEEALGAPVQPAEDLLQALSEKT